MYLLKSLWSRNVTRAKECRSDKQMWRPLHEVPFFLLQILLPRAKNVKNAPHFQTFSLLEPSRTT